MPNFSYVALDPTGKEQQGYVEADSQSLAISLIKEKGLFPTNVQESGAPAAKARRMKKKAAGAAKGKGGQSAMNMEITLPANFYRVKPKQLMIVTRQLATLINAGMPLLRCLQVLRKQEKNPALLKTFDELGEAI
ncbi:MAG: type II secretion system F family protein, partial [Verrucomicrobiota bacterium]